MRARKAGRQLTRAIEVQRKRAGRILAKVRRLSFLDGSAIHTPEQLINAMQVNADRLKREGTLRPDEHRDLKRLHTLQLMQLTEDAARRQRERSAEHRAKAGQK